VTSPHCLESERLLTANFFRLEEITALPPSEAYVAGLRKLLLNQRHSHMTGLSHSLFADFDKVEALYFSAMRRAKGRKWEIDWLEEELSGSPPSDEELAMLQGLWPLTKAGEPPLYDASAGAIFASLPSAELRGAAKMAGEERKRATEAVWAEWVIDWKCEYETVDKTGTRKMHCCNDTIASDRRWAYTVDMRVSDGEAEFDALMNSPEFKDYVCSSAQLKALKENDWTDMRAEHTPLCNAFANYHTRTQ